MGLPLNGEIGTPSSVGGGGGGGISEITSEDDSVTVSNPTGPITDLSVSGGGGAFPNLTGSGSPEGVITDAPVGQWYEDTSGDTSGIYVSLGPTTPATVTADSAPTLPLTVVEGTNDEFAYTQEWANTPLTFTVAPGTYNTLADLETAVNEAVYTPFNNGFDSYANCTDNGTNLVLTSTLGGLAFNGDTIGFGANDIAASLGFTGNPDTLAGGTGFGTEWMQVGGVGEDSSIGFGLDSSGNIYIESFGLLSLESVGPLSLESGGPLSLGSNNNVVNLLIGSGNPNGVVSALGIGDLFIDKSTPALWQSTDGATTWEQVGGGGGGYDSLTGAGQTASPGELDQAGAFTVTTPSDDTTGIFLIDQGSGGIALEQNGTDGITLATLGGGATLGIGINTQETDTVGISLDDGGTGGISIQSRATIAINSGGTGGITMTALPTADPHVANQLWNNLGILTVSAG